MPLQHKKCAPVFIHKNEPSGRVSRRAFCALSALGSAVLALAIPLVAAGLPRKYILIGVLSTGHSDPQVYIALRMQLELQLHGFDAGFNLIQLEASFSPERLLQVTTELLASGPDVIICLDITAAVFVAARRRGNSPPIVFLGHDDPLAYRLIQSYAHPGNNVTGVTTFRCVDGKMTEILAEAFPQRSRFGYLLDFSVDDDSCVRLAEEAAVRLGIHLFRVNVAAPGFLSKVRETLAPLRLDALIAPASATLWQNRPAIVRVLNDLKIPAIYESELFLAEGGLMYYGPIRTDAMAHVVSNVRKILSGERAGDLPVDQPTLFELVVNLKAPNAADYGIAASVLRRADRILQ